VNEAFACVAMIAMRDLGIPREQLNVHGGATALGPPDRRQRAPASSPPSCQR
jgi:acetyl-CoA acetyltransferase